MEDEDEGDEDDGINKDEDELDDDGWLDEESDEDEVMEDDEEEDDDVIIWWLNVFHLIYTTLIACLSPIVGEMRRFNNDLMDFCCNLEEGKWLHDDEISR